MPDLEIYFLRQFQRPHSIKPVGGLMVNLDHVVTYTVSTYITIECPFNFDNYPLDEQVKEIGNFTNVRNPARAC